MSARSLGLLAVLALALMLGTVASVTAQERWHDEGRRDGARHGEGWHDRDIHRFHDHDFDRWQRGRWVQGRHAGRLGWWWVVGPTWYYYPQPIYPYPDPYVPPAVAPAPNAWYYCPPRRAYYPYVATCPGPWQVVPAQ